MASPRVLVNNQTTENGIDVSSGSTVNIALEDISGVTVWLLEATDSDGYTSLADINSTISINQATKTATLQMPSHPASVLIKSSVNNSLNNAGIYDDSLNTKFKLCVRTSNNLRLGAMNERYENNISTGYTGLINDAIKSISAGGGVPIDFYGDLDGDENSQTVIGLQGYPISSTTPTTNQVLAWNGSAWAPATASATPSDATTSAKGIVQLAGDLGGTATSPSVLKVNGISVSGTPSNGQVLTASSSTAASWSTPAAGAGDATTLAKGIVQLAGDLGGTAASPSVLKINGNTLSGTAAQYQVLVGTGAGAISFGQLNLAQSAAITGVLPSANMTNATTSVTGIVRLTTDLAGTATAPTVVAASGASGTFPIKCAEVSNSSVTNTTVKDKIFYVQTTNATVTAVATLATTSNTLFQVDAIIMAKKSDHTAGAVYKRSITVRNVAGTLTAIGSVDSTDTKEDNAALDATLAISGTNIVCNVTGIASQTYNWCARISTIQLA